MPFPSQFLHFRFFSLRVLGMCSSEIGLLRSPARSGADRIRQVTKVVHTLVSSRKATFRINSIAGEKSQRALRRALVAKRLELLRELLPAATRVAALVNPANRTIIESTLRDLEPVGRAMGLQIEVVRAGTSREIDSAFAPFVRDRPEAHLQHVRQMRRQIACLAVSPNDPTLLLGVPRRILSLI